jgi:hypothetical protein
MPANPYSTIAANLTIEFNDVSSAFSFAQSELGTQGAPETFFLEIAFSGGKIIRNWDGNQVNGLPLAEQWRLYPQLGGLFNLAMRNLLYP